VTKSFIVLRADLSQVMANRPTQSEARDCAQELCERTGKPHVVAEIVGRVEVAKLPTRWVDAGGEGEE
jgi:hypothetical protein